MFIDSFFLICFDRPGYSCFVDTHSALFRRDSQAYINLKSSGKCGPTITIFVALLIL